MSIALLRLQNRDNQHYNKQICTKIEMSQPALLVDCHKIIQWLQQRRKLPKEWYTYEKASQQKLKQLLQNHQQEYKDCSIPELLPYIRQNIQNIHYGDVIKICDMLVKSKWGESKSLVFGYSDARVKQWVALKKFMEGKTVAVVNVGKFISQALSFDLPSIDKNVELLDNQIQTLKRKIDYNINTIYQQQKQENNQKNRLHFNIEQSVVQQIPKIIKNIPQLFKQTQQRIKQLAVQYRTYVKYCEADAEEGESKDGKDRVRLRVFEFVSNYGNSYADSVGKEGLQTEVADDAKYVDFINWKPYNQWGIQIQNNTQESKKQNRQTVLQNRQSRSQLLQDLNQLLYFYLGIKHEQSQKSSSSLSLSPQQSQQLSQPQLSTSIKKLQSLISFILTQISTWTQIKNNSKAYQILLRKFRSYEQNIKQIKQKNIQYSKQIEEMGIRREEIVAKMRKLRGRVVQAKKECQKIMSSIVGREVRITGEINKLE